MQTETIYKTAAGKLQVLSHYDTALANWPVPFETQTLSTRHGDTFLITCGKAGAPALVLLHGANSNAVSWIRDVAEYSRHYSVYLLDLPGEPGKSAPNRLPFQGYGYAEWLEDVRIGLRLKQFSLAGLSQGGWTALRYATLYPGRIEKLVLINPAGVVPTNASFTLRAVFFSLFGKAGIRQVNRLVVGRRSVDPKALAYMDTVLGNVRPRIEKEYLFTDEELDRLTMPVLLLAGAQDVTRPAQVTAARLARHILRLKIRIIPGMGHVLLDGSRDVLTFLEGR
ncbi:alpha/beta fold hydrolase [Larkinella soli]|uniref:alpha/beta fold hydrolase n=1 Tax=Larkinella soli TaxID=1770527 RepID=UPI0013E39815|nr:alpha/beta hydrolase [Larkinella soli]